MEAVLKELRSLQAARLPKMRADFPEVLFRPAGGRSTEVLVSILGHSGRGAVPFLPHRFPINGGCIHETDRILGARPFANGEDGVDFQ